MRIIAGKFKGKVLKEFHHTGTRPTGDKARGGIFNTLLYDIPDGIFLDIFGGTGAVGIEAESRGAKEVYIVDNNKESVKVIKENCKLCGTQNTKIFCMDYSQALKEFKNKNIIFDVVFIDPPYKEDYGEKALELIADYGLIDENSVVCFEHDNTKIIQNDKYELIKQRKYGIAIVDYLSLKMENGTI